MMEFTLVLIAVVAVVATKWESAPRWQMRIGGLLSFALGLRVMALVTATYLFPCFADILLAEEPVAAASAQATTAQATTAEAITAEATAPVQAAPANDKSQPKPIGAARDAESPVSANPAVIHAESTQSAPQTKPSGPGAESDVSQPAVAFITRVKYLTPNRPSWLESPPTYEGELFKIAVRAGPYQTVRDCEPDLEREVSLAVADFVNDHLRARHASTFIHYSLKDLRSRKVVRDQFSEQLETSVGLMSQVHAQLVFDNQFRNELDERWSEIKSKSRLAQTGMGAGIVLLFLGTMFSFLKLDTVTRGYYTGRLQFGAAATILTLVAASVLLMKWIPWM